jgi:hypothetical protein
MATAVQFGGKAKRPGAQLDPTLKEFLDVVVIPALVKAYLLEECAENRLANTSNDVPHSGSKDSASAKEIP